MPKYACRTCKRIVKGKICSECKGEATTNFQGVVVILDAESEIAKKLGITVPGTYAIRV
ncbi:MAG: transcription elongation factor subunit Spt4 [Candidatus Aenigmatarchaeota archaeon]